MKYVRMAFWIALFLIAFVIFTLNVGESVDFRYFYGNDDVFRQVPLFVVVFFSLLCGFVLGIILLSGDVLRHRRQLRQREEEITSLRQEIDTHRNVAVKEFLNGETGSDEPGV